MRAPRNNNGLPGWFNSLTYTSLLILFTIFFIVISVFLIYAFTWQGWPQESRVIRVGQTTWSYQFYEGDQPRFCRLTDEAFQCIPSLPNTD